MTHALKRVFWTMLAFKVSISGLDPEERKFIYNLVMQSALQFVTPSHAYLHQWVRSVIQNPIIQDTEVKNLEFDAPLVRGISLAFKKRRFLLKN